MKWQFDTKVIDEEIGWNNALVGEFKGNKLKSLICEILQNSLDNPKKDKKGPVKVVFEDSEVNQ